MLENVEVIDVPLSYVLSKFGDPFSSLLFGSAEVNSDFIYWEHKLEGIKRYSLIFILQNLFGVRLDKCVT